MPPKEMILAESYVTKIDGFAEQLDGERRRKAVQLPGLPTWRIQLDATFYRLKEKRLGPVKFGEEWIEEPFHVEFFTDSTEDDKVVEPIEGVKIFLKRSGDNVAIEIVESGHNYIPWHQNFGSLSPEKSFDQQMVKGVMMKGRVRCTQESAPASVPRRAEEPERPKPNASRSGGETESFVRRKPKLDSI